MTKRFSRYLALVLVAGLGASCSRRHDRARPADTLFVGTPTPAAVAGSSHAGRARTDSPPYQLLAFTGVTASSAAAAPPEIGITASDGRQAGFDPRGKRYLAEIPGADYDSSKTVDDDDGAPGDAPAEQAIDLRELRLPARAGEEYTLAVVAELDGVYVLHVGLSGGDDSRSVSRELNDLKLRRGQPRRFTIRIGAGTMELQRVADDAPAR